jgi:hypothetical protein
MFLFLRILGYLVMLDKAFYCRNPQDDVAAPLPLFDPSSGRHLLPPGPGASSAGLFET